MHAKVQARLQFPEGYPNAVLIVELKSDNLPQPFLRKLTKKAEEEAGDCMKAKTDDPSDSSISSGGHAGSKMTRYQAVAALRVVMEVVEKNKLLPCWKEMRQAATLATSR